MKWLDRWTCRRHTDTTDEGRAALDSAKRRDATVTQLGAELAEIRRRNHFSAMVESAIARTAKEA